MLGLIFGFILRLFGGNVVGQTLDYLASKEVQNTERARISSGVIREAMQHRVFWIAWGVAAVPMAAWFGWGMLDTLTNGMLPDVATIPPGLKPYAETVWSNIFWTGGVVASVGTVGSTIVQSIKSIFRRA